MKISQFIYKNKFKYKLSTMTFGDLYNSANIILFIFEKSLVIRILFRLRHEGLYALDVPSCRIAFNSGYYVSFHFKTLNQVLKFLELNYIYQNLSGFILLQQNFLNCSFIHLKQILLTNYSVMHILKIFWFIIWLYLIWSILFILIIIQSVLIKF